MIGIEFVVNERRDGVAHARIARRTERAQQPRVPLLKTHGQIDDRIRPAHEAHHRACGHAAIRDRGESPRHRAETEGLQPRRMPGGMREAPQAERLGHQRQILMHGAFLGGRDRGERGLEVADGQDPPSSGSSYKCPPCERPKRFNPAGL